jgi:hypothetical protein
MVCTPIDLQRVDQKVKLVGQRASVAAAPATGAWVVVLLIVSFLPSEIPDSCCY